MTHLPTWSYQGTVPFTGDLSILEAALHSGRVAAAELGYTDEPHTIETEEAMASRPDGDPDSDLLTAEQALAAGVEFNPTVLRYRMVWAEEQDPESGAVAAAGHASLSEPVDS